VALTESVQVPLFVTVKAAVSPVVYQAWVTAVPFGVTESANWPSIPSGSDVPVGANGQVPVTRRADELAAAAPR